MLLRILLTIFCLKKSENVEDNTLKNVRGGIKQKLWKTKSKKKIDL